MGTLHGKVAVVTGAGSGIGRALARELDRRGCRLALSDIDLTAVEKVAADCRQAVAHQLDVADRAAVLAYADTVVAEFGTVHVLVNNAGVALVADAEEQQFEDIDWLLGINLNGVISGTQAFLPHLIASGDGHLVNVSSVFGIIGFPGQSAYNAAKFGVRGYTEAIAMEMAINGRPVQVHTVHPGGIKTNIANAARKVGADQDLVALFDRAATTSPEAAARIIARGIERGTRRIHVGWDSHLIHAVERVIGSGYIAGMARMAPAVMRATGFGAIINRRGTTPATPPASHEGTA